jgi:hypothetical protein
MSSIQNGGSGSGRFMRRREAGEYLNEKYGSGSASALAKAAVTGDGPKFYKYGSKVVIYDQPDLDEWAISRLSPRVSTSDIIEKQATRGADREGFKAAEAIAAKAPLSALLTQSVDPKRRRPRFLSNGSGEDDPEARAGPREASQPNEISTTQGTEHHEH